MVDNYWYLKLDPVDDTYASLLLRRRFCKRIFILFCVLVASFYLAVYLFHDFKTAKVLSFAGVKRCPACCGITVCNSLYAEFEHIIAHPAVAGPNPTVYHGYLDGKKVVWKYLAEDVVFKNFDAKICVAWGLKPNCKWKELFEHFDSNKAMENIIKLVEWEPTSNVQRGLLTFCPDANRVVEFLQPGEWVDLVDDSQNQKNNLINLWTMLSINPEPVILQVMPLSHYWPLPVFGGCCGRIELVTYEGDQLSSLFGVCWRRKMEIAANIIKAAMDLTFADRRYRFYIMDWSAVNIVVNKLNEVAFSNLKRFVVFDSHAMTPHLKRRFDRNQVESWYNNGKNSSLNKLNELCTNDVSDYNIREACLLLTRGDTPFLLDNKIEMDPKLRNLLEECRNGLPVINAFKKASMIIHRLKDIVNNTLTRNSYKKSI